MSWQLCDGRECKLGWGYNKSLDRLIPVEEEPRNITSDAVKQWWYFTDPLSSTDLVCWVSLFIHSLFSMSISAQNKFLSGTKL